MKVCFFFFLSWLSNYHSPVIIMETLAKTTLRNLIEFSFLWSNPHICRASCDILSDTKAILIDKWQFKMFPSTITFLQFKNRVNLYLRNKSLFHLISQQEVPVGISGMRTLENIKKKFNFSSDHLSHSIAVQILVYGNFSKKPIISLE